MPEGPEIRLAADRVANVLLNQTVEAVSFGLQPLRRYERRLRGQRVVAVDTHGKAMLTRFDNGLTLYSHNQLYGRWYITRRPQLPNTSRQLRVALHTQTHSALLYSASDIAVLSEPQLSEHPFLARLGPDILDESLTKAQIAERLLMPRFRNRSLGSLYLDQSFLAGNGNYLRTEILWAAGVHPLAKPSNLGASAVARLAAVTLKISRRSYRTRGVTLPDAQARKLRAQGASYANYRFGAYGREGLPCRHCGASIERGAMGSRAVFVCPICQTR